MKYCSALILLSVLFSVNALHSQEVVAPEAPAIRGPNLEWQQIDRRFESYLSAYEYWLVQTCKLSDEQRQKVSAACKETFERAKVRFDAMPQSYDEFDGTEFLGTPFVFCGSPEAAPSLFDAGFKDAVNAILTPGQRETLVVAMNERGDHKHRVFANQLLEIIDELTYLRPEQRLAVGEKLQQAEPKFESSLFTFHAMTKELRSNPILDQAWYPSDILTTAQSNRVKSYLRKFDTPADEVATDCTERDVMNILDRKAAESMPMLEQYLSVPIDSYRSHLDEKTLDRLELASQGAIERVLADWRRGQMNQLYYDYGGMYYPDRYHFSNPRTVRLEYDAVWTATLNSDEMKQAELVRAPQKRDQFKAYMLLYFEQELWLTPEQTEAFQACIFEQIEFLNLGHRKGRQLQDYRFDLTAVGKLLHTIPDEKIEPLLAPEQFRIWQQLKRVITIQENWICYPKRSGPAPIANLWLLPMPDNS